MSGNPQYRVGLICLAVATFFTSTAGVLLRWIEAADGWTVLFYRSLFFFATLGVWLLLRHGTRLPAVYRSAGWVGVQVAILFSIGTVAFIFALLHTTVAKVVLINGLLPFVAALLGRWWLREPVAYASWIAMVFAFGGIVLMVGEGFDGGTLLGDGLALLCCLTTATLFVVMRRRPQVDKVPHIAITGLLIAALAAVLAPSLAISAHDLLLCALLGCLQLGVQYILVAFGAQHVPAAEVALTGRMTIVLAPLWAWLGAGEVPGSATLAGGALVLLAVFGNGLWNLQAARLRGRVAAP